MSRNLLILALLVSGTGCSATRPLLSTVVVTPPKLSFRQLPDGDDWQWNAVAVTYPTESLFPAPCAPSPVSPVELVTFFEEDECLALWSPSGPVPVVTTVVPVPTVNRSAPVPPTIVPLENSTSSQSVNPPVSSVAPARLWIPSIVQTASMSTLPEPPVRGESPPPIESHWKPATGISLVNPVQASTAMRCELDETTPHQVRQIIPVDSLSKPVLLPSDLSELLTEIRNQRLLIEALQRDLTRERSADDADLGKLEAAVEDLLVKTAQREMPYIIRK